MRRMFALAVIALALGFVPACKSSDANAAAVEEAFGKDSVITEKQSDGSIAWDVSADGEAKALVTTPDGKPLKTDVSGALVWKDGSASKTIPLAPDPKTGVLVARGPKLSADITEIDYAVSVAGRPWNGVLHLPPGGTEKLAADARAAIDVKLDGKPGPHGGSIQVVGKDRVEIVSSETTGEVRVYVLDTDLKPIVVGDRKITLAVVADKPDVVVLIPAPGGMHMVGKLHANDDPVKVTIAIRVGEEVHVTLVGWRPGVHVVVGADAPKVKIRVNAEGWGADEDVDVKVNGRGPAVKVNIEEEESIKIKHHGKGGLDVKIKVR
jgi:hypothetical protein